MCHGIHNYTSFIHSKFQSKKLTTLYTKDKYLSFARNYGSKYANGQWLAFLDDDDLWDRNLLRIFHDDIKRKKNLDIVYSNFSTLDLNSKKIIKTATLTNFKNKFSNLENALCFSNYVSGGSASAIRKSRFDQINMFDETLSGCEDHDFWRRAAHKKFIFSFINQKLVLYRKNNNNLGNNVENQKKNEFLHLIKICKSIPHYLSHELYNIQSDFFLRILRLSIQNFNFIYLIKILLYIKLYTCITITKKTIFFLLNKIFQNK